MKYKPLPSKNKHKTTKINEKIITKEVSKIYKSAKIKKPSYNLISLIALLCILVTFACVSISKFVLTDQKELVGVYTDFIISNDGNGQTAVIRTDSDGKNTGYIVTSVSNFTDEKVSKRDVKFSMRAPTESEVNAGFVTDAWGVEHSLYRASKYYQVTIVDENDNELTENSHATLLNANVRNSSNILLKIERNANAEVDMPTEGTEQISIILETSLPYRDLQVFTINTTTARLSVGVFSDVYNGFTRETVNLKSSTEFVRDLNYISGVSYVAEMEFDLDGDVLFDHVRFKETYGITPVYDEIYNKYIIFIRAGADVNLYFYVRGQCQVKVFARVDDGISGENNEKVSGVASNNVVFSSLGRTVR